MFHVRCSRSKPENAIAAPGSPAPLLLERACMRLDKYLKVSRLIKRRTVANEACDAGRVSVNGRVVKASYDVKPSDVIEVRFGSRLLKVEVVSISEHAAKSDAPAMYRELAVES